MTAVDDLRQDVESLENEIARLESRCQQVRKEIELKASGVPQKELRRNPIVEEFEQVFEKFPQLRDLLYNTADSNTTTAEPVIANGQTVQNSATKDEDLDDKDLEEHEWVLKNQKPLKHDMFDTSIADIIDTSNPIRESKASQMYKLGKLDTLKEQILLENSYRILGITFFPVLDPNDLQFDIDAKELVPKREMLGIRIDIFNEFIKKFESPSYILLKRQLKSKIWNIFKHTIPNYIPILKIFNDITLNGNCDGYEDIYLFSKEIYLMLYKESLRGQLLTQWEHMGLITGLKNNLRSNNVNFQIANTNIKLNLIFIDDKIVNAKILKGVHDLNLQNQICVILLGPMQDLEHKLLQLQQQHHV